MALLLWLRRPHYGLTLVIGFGTERISSSEMEDLSHIPRNIPSGVLNKFAGVSNS